jgi:hypothetical protein
MEAMLGMSLYNYPYLTSKNTLSFLLWYVFSSTKLEKRAEQILPGREMVGGQGGEMAQTMYAHMNK